MMLYNTHCRVSIPTLLPSGTQLGSISAHLVHTWLWNR